MNWRKGGNTIAGGNNPTIGTGAGWNAPFNFLTSGIQRIHINEQTANFLGVPTPGFVGMGANPQDVRSRLTITGTNNTPFAGDGYRNWMNTGVYNLENSDNFYVGLREEGINRSDAVLAFGDDNAGTERNNLRILYTQVGLPTDGDLEIARFTPSGEIGFGPVFQNGFPTQPKSLLHMNSANRERTWLQITNESSTGMQQGDGFRIGFQGGNNRPGLIRWQEFTPLVFQTDWNNNSGGTNAGERMRITTTNYLNTQGQYIGINPGNGNFTRVGISHNGQNPIERPMSLLHLGYDISSGLFGTTADGWRDWMDVGTFTAMGSDNMYVGLKNEGQDRMDAIINWGDNQPTTGGDGPDYLRFIFTSTTSSIGGNGDPVANSNDGLEVMRMDPQNGQTYQYNNSGMVGIGDFATSNQNAADAIDAKLDIDGDLRIRQVLQNDTLNMVLVIDTTDHNRVYWREIDVPAECWDLNENGIEDPNEDINNDGVWDVLDCQGNANVFANNGTSLDPTAPDPTVQFGHEYTGAANPAGPARLLNDREVPFEGNNILFTGNGNAVDNKLFIGADDITAYNATLGVFDNAHDGAALFDKDLNGANGVVQNYALKARTQNFGSGSIVYGVWSVTDQGDLNNPTRAYAVYGQARNNYDNVGVFGEAIQDGAQANYGSRNVARGNNVNVNYGVYADAFGESITGANYGVFTKANGDQAINYGIWAETNAAGNGSYAGYFDGDVHVVGNFSNPSDINLKQNISSITNADSIINQLNPVNFEFRTNQFPQLSFPTGNQFGLVAQEVEQVLPDLVTETTHPAVVDSAGNIVHPQVDYKALDYEKFIPLLVANSKSTNAKVADLQIENDSLQSVIDSMSNAVNDMNDRLTNLENCLGNILPLLCQMNQSMIQQNDQNVQEELRSIINVELENGENIVLNQNVPNPFAEQTVITYSIPESVGEAIIMFYDSRGVIIKEVKIETRGRGQLNVYGSDLSRGLYSYTLVADGQIIATKKMVKQ